MIIQRQQQAGWGNAVVEQIAADLRAAFPDVKGFSKTNVFRMRAFYLAYSQGVTKVPQAVGQIPPELALIPWEHNVCLIEKVETHDQ